MRCSAVPHDMPSLARLTARPDYFNRIVEVIRRVPLAADKSEALALLQRATRLMGADVSLFASFVRDDPTQESYRFLLACDPMWCHDYERIASYGDDPWLNYALRRSEPARGSEIPIRTAVQQAVVDIAARHGFRSSAIVPAPSSGRLTRVGVLALGSAAPRFFEGDGFNGLKVVARSLAMELHEWWIAAIRREMIDSSRITPDDLLLLRYEWIGHSTKQIAAALGTTLAAIDTRFQRINAKLGVPSRKAAATLAAEYGLI